MSGSAKSGKGPSQDLRPADLASLDWAPWHARHSLDVIYQSVVEYASQSITWYLGARRSKKRWAQRLRVAAIVMVSVAGVLPVLSQIFNGSNSVVIEPAWSSVALAIAVALIALDRFFGYSSAWMRYMATTKAISAALNEFRLDWQRASYQLEIGEPDQDGISDLLDIAKIFTRRIDDLVQAETRQWASEFRDTLTEIEWSAQKKR